MPDPAGGPVLRVLAAGPQTTVQDLGRPGYAALGVPRSGALDEPALRLAHRLVGNEEGAAGLECLLGGLVLQPDATVVVAVTGAQGPITVDGRSVPWGAAVTVPAGSRLEVGPVARGLRAYVAVAGGVDVPPVLGSRSTDLLSGTGPAVLVDGDRLPTGPRVGVPGAGEAVWVRHETVLRLRLGPREDRFEPRSLDALDGATYRVGAESNRIGLRLEGEPLRRRDGDDAELPSEGMVLGAVQVPPSGQPVVFLADHPVTGGYPVVGVVEAADLPLCAQLGPGDEVTLRVVGAG